MIKNLAEIINKFYIRKNYCNYNKKKFTFKTNSKNLILVEFNAFHESHVVQSIFANFLSKKFGLQIIGYFNYCILSSPLEASILSNIKWFLGKLIDYKNHSIYKSFGTRKILRPFIDKKFKKNYQKISKSILNKIKSKKDVLKISIKRILIGDLIYDTYLKSNKISTLDINDKKFHKMIYDFVCLFFYWDNLFKNNKVQYIIGVHTVYSYALPIRIGLRYGVKAYTINSREISKIDNRNLFMNANFSDFAKFFNKLNSKQKVIARNLASQHIKKRLSGDAGPKNHLISNISSFHNKKKKSQIIKNKNTKVLICTRNIFDATHVFGDIIFIDNYEWLNFLGEMSEKTDYDWYLKVHINFDGKFKIYQPISENLIFKILEKYKKIKILPHNYSHKQLIKEKIDYVITQHGSVAFEYAYFNIPVINCSYNNPQKSFKFNYHPKSKSELKNLILSLGKLKKNNLQINKNDILEFYFMRFLYQDRNWLFDKNSKMVSSIGGWDNLMSEKFYKYSMENINEKKILKLDETFENFLKSNYQSISILDTEKFNSLMKSN